MGKFNMGTVMFILELWPDNSVSGGDIWWPQLSGRLFYVERQLGANGKIILEINRCTCISGVMIVIALICFKGASLVVRHGRRGPSG